MTETKRKARTLCRNVTCIRYEPDTTLRCSTCELRLKRNAERRYGDKKERMKYFTDQIDLEEW